MTTKILYQRSLALSLSLLIPILLFSEVVPVDRVHTAAVNFLARHDFTGARGIRLKTGGEYSISTGQVPACYILNLLPEGFIIISADDQVYPVLGYAFTGSYRPSAYQPAFSDWLSVYTRQIGDIREKKAAGDPRAQQAWQQLLNPAGKSDPAEDGPMTGVAPLVTTTWDQTFPYNAKCPADAAAGPTFKGHVPVGCVATAMAQIMYYWRYPSLGSGTHCINPVPAVYGPQCADFGNTNYIWNGMVTNPEKECAPLATLCYHAGVAVDMNYGPLISLSFLTAVPGAMRDYFHYSQEIEMADRTTYPASNWLPLLRNNLDAGRPVIYYAEGTSGQHAFICDGYQNFDFFHFNWGWGGLYDGYYYLSDLTPGGMSFLGQQAAVVNIHPGSSAYPPYCTGQNTLNFPDFGSFEDGSGPRENYQNMTDCRWKIEPADSIQSIRLHFVRFSLGAADMIRVYDGADINAPVIASVSGTVIPADVTSTGKQMLVRLTSMLSTTSQGFLAEYTTTPYSFCKSDSIYTQSSAEISDGSGPYDYRNDTFCVWFVNPIGAGSVTLTFSEFDTEASEDVVTVFQPGSTLPLASYSGTYATPPPPLTSSAGSMIIQFTTNKTVRGKGWKATYTTPVGIPVPDGPGLLKIIPNPVENSAVVSCEGILADDTMNVSLSDVTGRELIRKNNTRLPWSFTRGGLRSGIYLLRISNSRGTMTHTARLVIR